MKKIKSIKWSVELSYRNTFVFQSITQAADFMVAATRSAEDPDDILNFRLIPYVEYEEESEEVPDISEPITESDI